MSDDIIPPLLDKDWRAMRAHLNLAAAHAAAGADASTVEDVRRSTSAAQVALMDADFIRRRIERQEPVHTNGSD